MFRRFWMVLRSWFGAGLDKLEDPELLLTQAQEEMTAMHAKNRERAVQAITQKNNLQNMVDETQRKVDNLQQKAEMALKRGDRDLALQVLKEKQTYEQTLATSRGQLEQAIATAEQVKEAIKREEMKIREKTAEALALKAQLKNNQIQIAMNKALEGIQGIDNVDSVYGRARSKINNSTSEMNARSELTKGNVQGRIDELEVAEHNSAAENELAALEAKLGLSSAPVTQTTTRPVETDIDRQLAELEARVGGAGSASGA
jgi:phage shock protein A